MTWYTAPGGLRWQSDARPNWHGHLPTWALAGIWGGQNDEIALDEADEALRHIHNAIRAIGAVEQVIEDMDDLIKKIMGTDTVPGMTVRTLSEFRDNLKAAIS